MKACLARGFPFLLGFSVYESFESAAVARTGRVPMPGSREAMLGGHAVVCCGYTAKGEWLVRNSWGAGWGEAGYFYFPQAYLLDENLSDDFWTVQQVK
jgi:C1A family cysteine protease